MKPLLIACDFDGTITQRDTLHVIVDEYGVHGLWNELEPRLRAGQITVEEAMQIEFAEVRATTEQVLQAVRDRAPLRPGFGEFVSWCERHGHRLVVASNGFRSVIEPVLREAGYGHLDVIAHDARFSSDGCELVWAGRGERCSLCDRPCKRAPLRDRWGGERLVYLGDGISDRCAAQMADTVFARDGLAEYLTERGRPFHPFETFHDVLTTLDAPAGVTR